MDSNDNITKSPVSVSNRLAHKSTGIIISIEDNGIGCEAAAAISKVKNGKGSKLIQERLEILQEKKGRKIPARNHRFNRRRNRNTDEDFYSGGKLIILKNENQIHHR